MPTSPTTGHSQPEPNSGDPWAVALDGFSDFSDEEQTPAADPEPETPPADSEPAGEEPAPSPEEPQGPPAPPDTALDAAAELECVLRGWLPSVVSIVKAFWEELQPALLRLVDAADTSGMPLDGKPAFDETVHYEGSCSELLGASLSACGVKQAVCDLLAKNPDFPIVTWADYLEWARRHPEDSIPLMLVPGVGRKKVEHVQEVYERVTAEYAALTGNSRPAESPE